MNSKHAYLCLLVLTAGCAGVTSEGQDETDSLGSAVSTIADGDYVIKSVNSGKCVDIAAASRDNGAKVQQWDCNGTVAQVFHLTSVGGGYYEISNPNSGKALDVRDVSYDNGAALQQWAYGGGLNQQFQIVALGNDEFSIRARHTGDALDVSSASQDNGAAIIQWPWHGGANQRFRFENAGGDPGQPGKDGWKLVWSDEFNGANGSAVDARSWTPETGGSGWGNSELEYYTDSLTNAHQENGSLVVRATRENASGYTCWYGACQYTSARLVTRDKIQLTYGRVEASIKIPRGQGMWPAFWMLGQDIGTTGWPGCGEIDIMENIGREPGQVHGSMHGPGYSGVTPETAVYTLPGEAAFADAFHVFAIEWEPNVVRFYVDDHLYQTRTPADLPAGTKWVYDHPFFILLNVAVGGSWPGSPDASTQLPQDMLVDYVRVYSRQ